MNSNAGPFASSVTECRQLCRKGNPLAEITGFHHLAMKTHDFDASVDFYTEVLGLARGAAWGAPGSRAVMLKTGDGSHLELFERAPGKGETEELHPLLHFALRVADCDAVLERVRETGAEITTDVKNVDIPSDPVYPVRIAFFRGPGGEIVELFQER